jgi:excisionase family DNA binding protein
MSRYSLFFGGYIYNFHTQLLQNYFNEPVGGTFIFSRKNVTSFSITFSGPTYESFNHMGTFCQTYKGQSFFEDDGGADNYWAAEKVINEQINCLIPDNYGTKLIYLNPKNTVISGTLNINAQSHLNNQSTQFTTSTNNKDIELGVYSSKEIAQKLRVSEEDILKLIRTGELRAKKIGEHYFIRKEDFDEYIRK